MPGEFSFVNHCMLYNLRIVSSDKFKVQHTQISKIHCADKNQ